MKNNKETQVLFEKYKKCLASLVKLGKAEKYADILSDADEGVDYDKVNDILKNSKEACGKDEAYVNKFRLVMSLLDKTSRYILIQDYFLGNNGWWFDLYSRATYYRMREYAEKKFLILMGKKPQNLK